MPTSRLAYNFVHPRDIRVMGERHPHDDGEAMVGNTCAVLIVVVATGCTRASAAAAWLLDAEWLGGRHGR